MINFFEYAQLSISAGTAKRLAVKSHKKSKWASVLKRHQVLKTTLAKDLRPHLVANDFVAALGKNEPKTTGAKRAHQLLNYDPSTFLTREYPTREALVYAVYEAHATERQQARTLEQWYNEIVSKIS